MDEAEEDAIDKSLEGSYKFKSLLEKIYTKQLQRISEEIRLGMWKSTPKITNETYQIHNLQFKGYLGLLI